jgi:hypothetical protein
LQTPVTEKGWADFTMIGHWQTINTNYPAHFLTVGRCINTLMLVLYMGGQFDGPEK